MPPEILSQNQCEDFYKLNRSILDPEVCKSSNSFGGSQFSVVNVTIHWGLTNGDLVNLDNYSIRGPVIIGAYSLDCRTDYVSNCTDSDGGKDYYVKGVVKMKYDELHNESDEDSCTGDGILVEEFCAKHSMYNFDTVFNEAYNCPYGCFDGACINSSESNASKNPCSTSEYLLNGKCYPLRPTNLFSKIIYWFKNIFG